MKLSIPEFTGRLLTTCLVICAAVWGLAHNLPFNFVDAERQWLIGVFRAAYGMMILLRLMRVRPAAPLVLGWTKTRAVERAIFWWMIPAVMMCVGFLTPVAVVAHLLFGSLLWRRSKVYSLEDVLIRSAGFCLLFLNSHLSFSVDSLLHWDFGLSSPSVIGLNFFAWTFAVLMFSAGFEKLCSPVWRRGLGFFYFMSLRHIAKPGFGWVTQSLWLSRLLSWTTILTQALFLLSFIAPPLRLIAFPMMAAFVFGLCAMVYLAFLSGQTFLSSSLLIAIQVRGWLEPLEQDRPVLADLSAPLLWIAGLFLVLGAVSASGLVRLRGGAITTLSAWTIALRPIMIFVETHLYGIYLFRLTAVFNSGHGRKVFDVFTDDGTPDRLQVFRPRTLQGTQYRVTDYCIAALEDIPERAADRAGSLVDLAYGGYLELSGQEQSKLDHIEFEVRVFDPDDHFVTDTSRWLSPQWQSIGIVRGFPDQPKFERGEMPPPRYKKTFRWPVQFA